MCIERRGPDRVLRVVFLWAFVLVTACHGESAETEIREWTSGKGTKLMARVTRVYVSGKTPMVELHTAAGKNLKLRIDQLSGPDQDHIYREYADQFGRVRVTRSVTPPPPKAAEEGGFKVEVRKDGYRAAFPGLDLEYLFVAPEGARLTRGTIPVTGDRDGGDAWLQRILVGHAIWWAQAGMLESRYQFNSDRLEKHMWREFGGKLAKARGGELHVLAASMNALLAERAGEVAGVRIQYLSQVTPELLCAAAKGPAMVAVNLAVLKGGRTQWESPVAVLEAWDDGKLRIALWDELMEVRMEARPEDEWIKVGAPKDEPAMIPVYTLRVDPADTSVNAEHLRSNEYELRVGPRNREAAVLVYSPQFTPKARE